MAISIYDLEDDEEVIETQQPEIESELEEEISTQTSNEGEGNALLDFLKTRGIEDSSRIKFEGDNGEIVERDWNDLSREEQFNILNTPLGTQDNQLVQSNDNELSEDEVNFLNAFRNSNLSMQDFIQSLLTPQEPQYLVDLLSDDEVYILDLESKVGELNDDEIAQALSVAKQNEDFYNKQVEGIRRELKLREEDRNQQELALAEQEQQQVYAQYLNDVVNAIDNFTSVGNLDLNLENEDKDELASFMLEADETGKNYLWQALQDPEILTKAAWFILNGEEAFNSLSDYYLKLIKLVSENQYKQGLEDGKKGVTKPTVVINKNNRQSSVISKKEGEDITIDDLFD